MMEKPIKYCIGNHSIPEHVGPFGKRLVRSEDGRPFLVPCGNELEEPVGEVFVDWQVSNLIDDDEGVLQAMLDDLLCPVLPLRRS